MTSEQAHPELPQPQQRQRSRQVKPIRLQERDLDLFASLSIARYLSVYAIEWLHYNGWRGTGGWRERYKAFLEKRKIDPSAVYYPAPNIYHRMTALRAGPDPLVHRVARSVERASVVYNRLPDAYTLTGAGASLLCARRGYELDDLWYEDPRRRSIKNFEHSVSIGTFYAALRAALEFSGQTLAPRNTWYVKKYVQTLDGPVFVAGKSKRCLNPACPHPGATYYASAVLSISLPYSTYALDVLAFIGWRHEHDHCQLVEIQRELQQRGLLVNERTVGKLYRHFLALLGGMTTQYQQRLETAVQQHGGLIWAIDALQPQGSDRP